MASSGCGVGTHGFSEARCRTGLLGGGARRSSRTVIFARAEVAEHISSGTFGLAEGHTARYLYMVPVSVAEAECAADTTLVAARVPLANLVARLPYRMLYALAQSHSIRVCADGRSTEGISRVLGEHDCNSSCDQLTPDLPSLTNDEPPSPPVDNQPLPQDDDPPPPPDDVSFPPKPLSPRDIADIVRDWCESTGPVSIMEEPYLPASLPRYIEREMASHDVNACMTPIRWRSFRAQLSMVNWAVKPEHVHLA